MTIERSVEYLASDAAIASIAADTYWPKWDSPWWHMLLLWELGEARRIPDRVVRAMIDGVNALPLKIFPISVDDAPGADRWRDSSCHCALGCLWQMLEACGVDVAGELPWIEPWFVRYQMADGGLNCDETAYRVADECPSSMVATIAPFEAMCGGTASAWSVERRAFVDRAAGFLIARRLVLGSPTRHNAAERDTAPTWLRPCFPRFYFYDVLRGLAALVRWARTTGTAIPHEAVSPAVEALVAAFPRGEIILGRRSFAGQTTLTRMPDGTWQRGRPASHFALLDATSVVGEPSPTLTRAWAQIRIDLRELATS